MTLLGLIIHDYTVDPLTPQRIRFASMERDTESNRFQDHARHYEFNLSRFLSPDIIGGRPADPQSWNRYVYGSNNPLRNIDPNGQNAWDIIAGFANALGSNFLGDTGRQWRSRGQPCSHVLLALRALPI